jgi:hypothetical protein
MKNHITNTMNVIDNNKNKNNNNNNIKYIKWRKKFILKHNNKVVFQVILFFLIPFIWVLIQTILYPGKYYCNNNQVKNCTNNRNESPVPDVAMIPIALIFYAYCIILGFMIIFSSGSWMENAFIKKLLMIGIIFLICLSIIQVIASAVYRGYVVPYSGVHQYNITIIRKNNTCATFLTVNLWSNQYPTGENVMVQVQQMPSYVSNIREVSPFSRTIYSDSSYSNDNIVVPNVTIKRLITSLQDAKWYIWEILPARKGINGSPYPGNYLYKPANGIVETIYGTNLTNTEIDLRAYIICQWNEQTGCEISDQ